MTYIRVVYVHLDRGDPIEEAIDERPNLYRAQSAVKCREGGSRIASSHDAVLWVGQAGGKTRAAEKKAQRSELRLQNI